MVNQNIKVKLLTSKLKDKEFSTLTYSILDNENVLGLIPILDRETFLETDEEIIKVGDFGTFKEYHSPPMAELNRKNMKQNEAVIFGKSRYSQEFINKAIKTGQTFYGAKDSPRFFLSYNEESQQFTDNQPLLIIINQMCFLLAPRIEEQNGN